MNQKTKKIIVICGPTATGKTDLGIELATLLKGEVISCDSRQVYKGLDIGSGKLPKNLQNVKKGEYFWTIDGVKVWMYDVVDPKVRFTIADYLKQTHQVIIDLVNREKLPIIVGGTGLYLKGLVEGLDHLEVISRKQKSLEKLDRSELQKKLQFLSPATWEQLNNSERNNPRRLIRKIELLNSISKRKILAYTPLSQNFQILILGLTTNRASLNKLIDERVVKRIDQGLVEEGEKLKKENLTTDRMKELGLEYAVLADFLNNKITSKSDFTQILQTKIHQFAKRQMTWFNKQPGILWFDINDKNWKSNVVKLASNWYNS